MKQSKNKYHSEIVKLKKTLPNWSELYCQSSRETLVPQLIRLEVLGQPLCRKYSWAIPDERALKILENFSPLIEIGCGKGYWASLLLQRNVNIVAFDREVVNDSWTNVLKGGPEMLLVKKISRGRNLFLSYPDEDGPMAMECLRNFKGDYIIHVGELMSTGTFSSPQAPWGRTSASDFQVRLYEEFHCLLVADLPRFPFSRDSISVWKRTKWVNTGESCEVNDQDDVVRPVKRKYGDEYRDEDTLWASIPPEERIPTETAAPCLSHLLEKK